MHIKQSRYGSMEVICRDDSIKFPLTQDDKIRREIINRVIKSKNKFIDRNLINIMYDYYDVFIVLKIAFLIII